MLAYLGPVTSTYTVRDTEWQSLSILPFAVTVTRGGRTAYALPSNHISLPPPSICAYSSGLAQHDNSHHLLEHLKLSFVLLCDRNVLS